MKHNESFFSLVYGVITATLTRLIAIVPILAIVALWIVLLGLSLARVIIDMILQILYSLQVVQCADASNPEDASEGDAMIFVKDTPRSSRLELRTPVANIPVIFFPHREDIENRPE